MFFWSEYVKNQNMWSIQSWFEILISYAELLPANVWIILAIEMEGSLNFIVFTTYNTYNQAWAIQINSTVMVTAILILPKFPSFLLLQFILILDLYFTIPYWLPFKLNKVKTVKNQLTVFNI